MKVEKILRNKSVLVRKDCRVVICDYRVVPSAWIDRIDMIEKNGWAIWDGLKKDLPAEILNRDYACAIAIERKRRGKGIEKIAIVSVV
jgi:hypothetical protein